MADYKDLELLVARIQRELAPNAEILHNQFLPGRKSNRKRQIDVLVRDRIGQYEILIVIDCKDYKRRVDVKAVEEFYGLVDDVGAQKGVLVCPAGFSEAAKTRADGLQMDLFSPVDTDPHKWKIKAEVPTICDFRAAGIGIAISSSSPVPITLPFDFQFSKQALDGDGNEIGAPFISAAKKWNSGEFPCEIGTHENLDIYGLDKTLIENGHGTNIPVELIANISVSQFLFFGHMPITRISGFKDEIKGGVITNAFTVGLVTPDEVFSDWQQLEKIEDSPQPPVLSISALMAWDENEFGLEDRGTYQSE